VVKSAGGAPTEVLQYVMKAIAVLSLTTQVSATGDLLDDVELYAKTVTLSVWNQTLQNGTGQSSVDAKWDQVAGTLVY